MLLLQGKTTALFWGKHTISRSHQVPSSMSLTASLWHLLAMQFAETWRADRYSKDYIVRNIHKKKKQNDTEENCSEPVASDEWWGDNDDNISDQNHGVKLLGHLNTSKRWPLKWCRYATFMQLSIWSWLPRSKPLDFAIALTWLMCSTCGRCNLETVVRKIQVAKIKID